MADITKLVMRLDEHPDSRIVTHGRQGLVTRSYAQLRQDVNEKLADLRRRGLREHMRVGVLANNSYEWLVLDLALLSLRCEVVALTPVQLEGGPEVIAADQELCALLVVGSNPIVRASSSLGWVVAADARDPIPLRAGGREQGDPEWAVPFRVFSSGSTGLPRCMSAPRAGLDRAIDDLRSTYEFDASDTVLLFLPVANLQQRYLTYGALWHGVSITLVEPINLMLALKEGRPTILLAPPLFFETVSRRITSVTAARWLLRALAPIRAGSPLARVRRAVLAPLRRRIMTELGGRMRMMITGMAPIGRATLNVYAALDLPLFEAYGMTECGIIASNTPRAHQLGSVGPLAAGVRIELAPDGEIIVERPVPFTNGYVGVEPSVNAETYVGPNRVATGDLGRMDGNGFLYLIGRKKNAISLPDGRKIHPEELEREITAIPMISQAAILPDGTAGLACVVHSTDRSARFEDTTRRALGELVKELSGQELSRVVFSKEPFTPQNGLLTQNLKLNRSALRTLLTSPGQA